MGKIKTRSIRKTGKLKHKEKKKKNLKNHQSNMGKNQFHINKVGV
jgi:hypothetical protein